MTKYSIKGKVLDEIYGWAEWNGREKGALLKTKKGEKKIIIDGFAEAKVKSTGASVAIDPSFEIEISKKLMKRNRKIVGWVHNHPPDYGTDISLTDQTTQIIK